MIQMKIIKSHSIQEHQDNFNAFSELFNDSNHQLREVESKVEMNQKNGRTLYYTFITYFTENP